MIRSSISASFIAACTLGLLACPESPDPGTDEAESTSTEDGETEDGETETGDPNALMLGPCDPSADVPDCPQGFMCCSDDPIALDLANIEALVTPEYQGRDGEGNPVMSGFNNVLSTRGMCVNEAPDIGTQFLLTEVGAQNCLIPCNPTWSATDINTVCGNGGICCANLELEPNDCVLDPSLGDGGCWRPVTGFDIEGLGGLDATNWANMDHSTHQDPGGQSCATYVEGIPSGGLDGFGLTPQDVLRACYQRLTVANQRGFCLDAGSGATCPQANPNYVDACEQLNLDEGRTGC